LRSQALCTHHFADQDKNLKCIPDPEPRQKIRQAK